MKERGFGHRQAEYDNMGVSQNVPTSIGTSTVSNPYMPLNPRAPHLRHSHILGVNAAEAS